MWEQITRDTLIFVYLAVLAAVAMYGLHRYVLVYLYLKHRHKCYRPQRRFADLPRVTVQLPMYNEGAVAARIIRAACRIDYPPDRLEIQVLDDSTDHSAEIARRACAAWSAKGRTIRYIHRNDRTGYKAGALEAGLQHATGEFIAIFDADFVPPRDILHHVVHCFTDDRIGMVQVRWDHLNRNASLLTRTQAIFLDGHFMIEHTARNRSGRFMHFNGTAGVWRRQTIRDAGGWQHDTLTEDLDLSYRAQLKGWQFVYLPQYAAPAELPPEMLSFKQQAHRWTKGSFQTAIKLLPNILRSRNLSWRIRLEAFFHLTNTLVYPLMVMLTILLYPAFFRLLPFEHGSRGQYVFSASLFLIATCSAGTFFICGQRELLGRPAGWRTLLHLPFLMGLGVGISLNNTKAVLEAVWSALRRAPSEFLRTPKYGVTGNDKQRWRREVLFESGRLSLPILEIAFGLYMAGCAAIALYWETGRASIPFLVMFSAGYFYVGLTSLHALYKMNQDTQPAPLGAEPVST